jgi:hypothetical protein
MWIEPQFYKVVVRPLEAFQWRTVRYWLQRVLGQSDGGSQLCLGFLIRCRPSLYDLGLGFAEREYDLTLSIHLLQSCRDFAR